METQDQEVTEETELAMLKDRADLMGIKYHPNIGLDKLRDKVKGKMDGDAKADEAEADPDVSVEHAEYAGEEVETIKTAEVAAVADVFTPGKRETAAQITARLNKEATQLVRIRIACMNPLKGAMTAEQFSVGNGRIGFLKKVVPFNVEAGWHVPKMIVDHIRQKKFISHFEVKVNGKKVNKHKLIPEYSVEILDPLTAEEMQELKQRQLMAAAGVE